MIQTSIKNWGNLLIATGGALQPAKCFYSIISYEWTNGVWSYRDNSIRGDFGVTVSLLRGAKAGVGHRPVMHSEKILGAMTSPNGDSSGSLSMMQNKAQQWIDLVRNGHLHCQNVWFSLNVQFWPSLGYVYAAQQQHMMKSRAHCKSSITKFFHWEGSSGPRLLKAGW